MVIDSIISAFVNVLGGQEIVLTIFGFAFLYTIGFVFFKISV
jgi:hypothetical protein